MNSFLFIAVIAFAVIAVVFLLSLIATTLADIIDDWSK